MVVQGRDLVVTFAKQQAQRVLRRCLRPVAQLVSAELVADQRATGDILSALLDVPRCCEGNVCLANELAVRIEQAEQQLYQMGATRGDLLTRTKRARVLFEALIQQPDPVELLMALDDALELAEEGWSYADQYYRKKWEFERRFASLRAVAAGAKERLW